MSALLVTGLSSSVLAQGDDCASAVPVTPGVYTADGPLSGGGGVFSANGDWYSFTAPCNGTMDVSACISGTAPDTYLLIYEDDCPSSSAESIATDDDFCAFFGPSAVNGLSVTAGTTYYIEWSDTYEGTGFDWEFDYNPDDEITGIGDVTTSVSSDLTWTPAGDETSWNVEYGPDGFIPGTGTTVSTLTPSVTITGLSPEVAYDVYITPVGGTVCIVTAEPYDITTNPLCAVPVAAITSGITDTDATLEWDPGASAETLWDVSWGTMGTLIGAGTDVDDTPFDSEVLAGLTPDTDYEWYVRAVCDLNLLDGVDTVSLWVGPIEFTTDQVCADPSGLAATPAAFEADLTWTPGGAETEWNIEYGPSGYTFGTGTSVAGVTAPLPYTLTGLTPETSYDYYVQSVCGSTPDSLSNFVGPFTFTTNTYCDAPTGILTYGITTDSAIIDWADGTGTDWELEWGLDGFTPGTGTLVVLTESADTLSGLTNNTTYCYYLRSVCGSTDDSSSVWMGPFCFTTQAICNEPISLDAINITTTAAYLLFTDIAGATSWNIEWGVPGFDVDAGEESDFVDGTMDNPHYATGLMESTPYWYYVQAVCGSTPDSLSNWAGPFQFGTEIVNDKPCEAIEIIVDDPQRQFHNFEATVDIDEASVTPPGSGDCEGYDGWCTGDAINQSVWFEFTAPASGAVNVSTFDSLVTMTSDATEIAVYSAADCNNYSTFVLEGANTLHPSSPGGVIPYGSELVLCGLNAGENYYLLVDAISFESLDIIFGIEITSIDAAPEAGFPANLEACEGEPVDFFNTITGNSSADGQWYSPSAAPGNEAPSAVSGLVAGSYGLAYVIENACAADTVETILVVSEGPSAGGDGSFTTCNTFDVVLLEHLVGTVELGGNWIDDDATDALFGGLFVTYGLAAGSYNFTYVVEGGGVCPDDSASVVVTLTDCLGEDENELGTLEVFPNPVSDVLTIQNLNIEGKATIELIDAQGKIISTNIVSGIFGNYELDMTELESGMYFVKIVTDNTAQKVRVVKQ